VQIEGLAEALTRIDFGDDDGKAGVVESRQNHRDILRQISEQLEKYNDSTAGGDFDTSLYTLGEKFADVKERIEEVVDKAEKDDLD
jgi:chromosome condensin MukBEF ATPase and DNA-binding subunit MukB